MHGSKGEDAIEVQNRNAVSALSPFMQFGSRELKTKHFQVQWSCCRTDACGDQTQLCSTLSLGQDPSLLFPLLTAGSGECVCVPMASAQCEVVGNEF